MPFFQIISPLLGLPPINILLQALLNQYLSDAYCLTFVLEQPIDFNINVTFTHITPYNGTVKDLTDQLLVVSEKGCSDYVVHMSDVKKFMAALDEASRLGNNRRSNRKIIILPFAIDERYVNETLDVFSMRESTFVANMLIVLPNEQYSQNCDMFDLVTHKFVSLDHDQPLYLDQWSSCTEKFNKNANLFPHDLRNVNGRILRVACFHYTPYSLLNLDTALEPTQRDGMEIRIVDEFCRWINCTIEIVDEEKDQWGEIFENRTGVGILGSVVMDKADMGISALYSWYEEFLYLDFSAASIRSGITCVAPSPKLLASWEMPLMPFSESMWCAIVLAYIASVLALMLAKKSTDGVFLTVFGMMIVQPQDDKHSWRIRVITGWMLGASLVLVSAYGAGLASTFTVPKYEASIDTVQNLVDRGMEWGATHDAWIFSIILSEEPKIKNILSQFKTFSAEELKRRSFMRNMAFSIEKLPAGSFAIGDYVTKDALRGFTLMLEDFYYEQCVIMLRKSSVYTEKISELIGRLHQSGLLLNWETQVSLKYLNFEVQQEVRLSRTKSETVFTTALNLHHVVGVYFLYLLGVVIATLIFIGEWFKGKMTTQIVQVNLENQ